MNRLTRRILLAAAASVAVLDTPVDAQIFGRAAAGYQQALSNRSCEPGKCSPSMIYGHHHENWRRWPEDDRSDLVDLLSPFTTKGGAPESVIPDAINEDNITNRKSRGPGGTAPMVEPPTPGAESLPPGAPSDDMTTSDGGLELPDLPEDNLPSGLPTDDGFGVGDLPGESLPGDNNDNDAGLLPDFNGSQPQPENDSELDEIFDDFGSHLQTTPSRRVHQMRRPPLTQRPLAYAGRLQLPTRGVVQAGAAVENVPTRQPQPVVAERPHPSTKTRVSSRDQRMNPLRRTGDQAASYSVEQQSETNRTPQPHSDSAVQTAAAEAPLRTRPPSHQPPGTQRPTPTMYVAPPTGYAAYPQYAQHHPAPYGYTVHYYPGPQPQRSVAQPVASPVHTPPSAANFAPEYVGQASRPLTPPASSQLATTVKSDTNLQPASATIAIEELTPR